MRLNKTPEKIAIQKAIVFLYLRKRETRRLLREVQKSLQDNPTPNMEYYENGIFHEYMETANNLELMKRVLWHDNWD